MTPSMAVRCRSTASINPGSKRNLARRVRFRNPRVAFSESSCCPAVSPRNVSSGAGTIPRGSWLMLTAKRCLPSKYAARGGRPGDENENLVDGHTRRFDPVFFLSIRRPAHLLHCRSGSSASSVSQLSRQRQSSQLRNLGVAHHPRHPA